MFSAISLVERQIPHDLICRYHLKVKVTVIGSRMLVTRDVEEWEKQRGKSDPWVLCYSSIGIRDSERLLYNRVVIDNNNEHFNQKKVVESFHQK